MSLRRALSARPVNSEKIETTWSFLLTDFGTADVSIVLAQGGAGQVPVGAVIKSLYLEFNSSAGESGVPRILHWKICKAPAGQTVTSPNVYDQVDKAQIYKRGMEMIPNQPSTIYKRMFVIKIPRGKQRMRDGERWFAIFRATDVDTINNCGICIYKVYT